MPAAIIDVRSAEDVRDVVHRAVQALAEGKLVVFPTETVYGLAASAFNEQAIHRIIDAKGRREGHPFALAVKSADDALDYVPRLPPLGRRLARRCWPGPVTLVVDDNHPDSALRQLPAAVQQAVAPSGTIGLRAPAHRLILDVVRLLAGPLVLTSANKTGEPDAVTAQEAARAIGEHVEMILDDGRCQFGQPSSVVRVHEHGYRLLRTGVVSAAHLKRLASFVVLLVCTGNTCRSPMAEMLLKKRLADCLGCTVAELEDRGVLIASAGIAAMSGGRAASEAVKVMADRGLDLTPHESQPLTDRLMTYADLVFTMTRSHREAVLANWPHAAGRVAELSPNGDDVADPIGGPLEVYRRCADQLDALLARRLDELELSEMLPDDLGEHAA